MLNQLQPSSGGGLSDGSNCWCACLLAPELACLLHAAKLSKLYVIQQAVKETQPATDTESTTARTSSVRAPVLQKFTFLAAKITNTHVGNTQGPSPQEQLDKYMK